MTYNLALAVQPGGNLFLGGRTKILEYRPLYRKHWEDLLRPRTPSADPHGDIHAFAFWNGAVYVGTDGGLWRWVPTNNRTAVGAHWDNLNTAGLNTMQLYSISQSPNDPNTILEGSQDNGAGLTTNGGTTWNWVWGADSPVVRYDPKMAAPATAYEISPAGPGNFFFRSTNNGESPWNNETPDFDPKRFPLFPPMAVNPDPSGSGHVLVGGKQVYESLDGGTTWTLISRSLVANRFVTALAYGPAPDGAGGINWTKTAYAAYADGGLWKTTGAGAGIAQWQNISPPGFAGRRITGIATDPNLPDNVYVTYTAFMDRTADGDGSIGTVGQVMRYNGGAWVDIAGVRGQPGSLPNVPANAIVAKADPNGGLPTLYVATDVGVYEGHFDAQAGPPAQHGAWVWTRLGGDELPYVQVDDLQLRTYTDGRMFLAAATHGRGAWLFQLGQIQINVQPNQVGAVEGILPQQITVATFTTSDPNVPASDFSAQVSWGDGEQSSTAQGDVTIQADPTQPGLFDVIASKPGPFADEGSFTFAVAVTDSADGSTASANGTATVADAALSAAGRTFMLMQPGLSINGVIATLHDDNPFATAGDFTVTVTWGDGSAMDNNQTGTITVTALGNGDFQISGTHSYPTPTTSAGSVYTIGITIVDDGGKTASAATSVSVSGSGGGGGGGGGGIVTDCCPAPGLPDTLYLTVSGNACLDGTYKLTYNGMGLYGPLWVYSGPYGGSPCGGGDNGNDFIALEADVQGSCFTLSLFGCSITDDSNPYGIPTSCSPFELTYTATVNCYNQGASTTTFTVTQ